MNSAYYSYSILRLVLKKLKKWSRNEIGIIKNYGKRDSV